MLFGQLNILSAFQVRSETQQKLIWLKKKIASCTMRFQCNSAERKTIIFSTSDLGPIQIHLKLHQSSLNQPEPSVLKLNKLVLQKQKCLKKTSISRMKLIVNETIKHNMDRIWRDINLQSTERIKTCSSENLPEDTEPELSVSPGLFSEDFLLQSQLLRSISQSNRPNTSH